MEVRRKTKAWFLSFFRDVLLYHSSSLEFRAKLIASVIGANKNIDDCEDDLLKEVAIKTYPNDHARADVLISTTKEYVKKIIDNNGLDINELILSIRHDLKDAKRFHQKIDIDQLKQFLVCAENNEETHITQLRVIEFLENSIDNFNKLR